MTSTDWTEFSKTYTDKLSQPLDANVKAFVSDLSSVFDKPPVPNLVNWDNYGQEFTKILELEHRELITETEMETLKDLLGATQKRQARIPYEDALTNFEAQMELFTRQHPTLAFTETDTAIIEKRMKYVHSGVQKVVDNSLKFDSVALNSSRGEAWLHLDFLDKDIKADSLPDFPHDTPQNPYDLNRFMCTDVILRSIKTLCETARDLYRYENRYALANQTAQSQMSSTASTA
jgi:hypothetical protein